MYNKSVFICVLFVIIKEVPARTATHLQYQEYSYDFNKPPNYFTAYYNLKFPKLFGNYMDDNSEHHTEHHKQRIYNDNKQSSDNNNDFSEFDKDRNEDDRNNFHYDEHHHNEYHPSDKHIDNNNKDNDNNHDYDNDHDKHSIYRHNNTIQHNHYEKHYYYPYGKNSNILNNNQVDILKDTTVPDGTEGEKIYALIRRLNSKGHNIKIPVYLEKYKDSYKGDKSEEEDLENE